LYSLVFAGFFPLIIIFGIGAVGIIIWLEIMEIKRKAWEIVPEEDKMKLIKAGIHTISTLKQLSRSQLEDLSENTGIAIETILKLQDIIELSAIPGINIQFARILKEIGIDSIKELARRNPDNKFKKFNEYLDGIGYQNTNVEPPSLKQIKKWIDLAGKEIIG
jgi:replicative superfamily II helicase